MKRVSIGFVWLGYLAVGVLLASCAFGPVRVIASSGNVVTQTKEIEEFERIDVGSAFQVEVRQGDAYKVTVEVDEAAVPYLRVAKQGNTLQIGLEPGVGLMGNATLRGEVTLPTLTGLTVSGASPVDLSGFSTTDNLDIRASGASRVRGEIDGGDAGIVASGASEITLNSTLQDLSIEASGASNVTLTGSGQNVRITASGASPVNLAEFPVEDATIRASGASNVTVQPSGTLDVEASGASNIYYSGTPTLGNVNTTGASSISRR